MKAEEGRRALLAVLAHPDDESYGIGGTLARYADEGVDVHVAIATDGAAGTAAQGFEEVQPDLANHRSLELERAAAVLGATVHRLGYRDSGMRGHPDNDHEHAFIQANEFEAVGRVVRLIREIRPQVVITHDETGGYFHPDHIFCWQVTTAAFHAAGDATAYPEIGLPPHQPARLYYSAFSNRWIKVLITLMRLRGQDPRRVGRNRDIDFTQLGLPPKKVHAHIDYRDYWDTKVHASAEHGSQGGGTGMSRLLPRFLQRQLFGSESFQRGYPPLPDGAREDDLFSGL
jgi:LmbE family N-acetylglucosaminyl deacetylase